MMLAMRNGAFRALSVSPFAISTPARSFSSISSRALRKETRLQSFISQRRALTFTALRAQDTAAAVGDTAESAPVSELPQEASVNPSAGPISQKEPTRAVYVGNLLFDITEEDLRKEFNRFGQILSVKIIYDSRGLSKGFGYVEFGEVDHATAAIAELNGQNFEGRRVAVDYVVRQAPGQTANREPNPPSKTLYIGNMSFEMSAKDLDTLFRDIKNVIDVRVAIDRRTGQPRGFAHADFLNQEAAEAAYEKLNGKEVHGRPLRVDFSKRSREGRRIGEAIPEASSSS